MWYEDLRPFGATEREIFNYLEHLFGEKQIVEPASDWLAEGQPFAALARALFWCCEERAGFVIDDVAKAAAAAPRSPLTRVVAGFVLSAVGKPELAREHLRCLDNLMVKGAVGEARRVLDFMDGNDSREVVSHGETARVLREELLVKLGRSAGLVAPHYEVDREDRQASLKFLFLLAKFRGDLQEAVGIGERLVGMTQSHPGVAHEVQSMEREIAVVRAQKLREEVEEAKRAAQQEASAMREQMEEAREGLRALAQEAQDQANRTKEVLHEQAGQLRQGGDDQPSVSQGGPGHAGEGTSISEKYEAALQDLVQFLEGEPEDGEIHRTFMVIKAEIATYEEDWSGLEALSKEGAKRWPEQVLWEEYTRTARVQQLFDSYQTYERDGDDRNAWNTLEVLLGLDPDNPDFQERAANFRHVIPGGREDEIRALFAPNAPGTTVEGGKFVNIEVGECWIKAHVVEADGARAFLILEHPANAADRGTRIPSFAMRLIGTGGQSSAGRTIRALARAVVQNAPDDFPWIAASFSDS